MISRDDVYALYVAANRNIPTPPLTVVRLCETIFSLYERIDGVVEREFQSPEQHQAELDAWGAKP